MIDGFQTRTGKRGRLEAGCVECVLKPLQPHTLENLVHRFFGGVDRSCRSQLRPSWSLLPVVPGSWPPTFYLRTICGYAS
jgi:hypothetical protein